MKSMSKIGEGKDAIVEREGNIVIKKYINKTPSETAEVENFCLHYLTRMSYPVPEPKGLYYKNNSLIGVQMGYVSDDQLQDNFFQEGYGSIAGKILGKLHHRLHVIPLNDFPSNFPMAKDLFAESAKKHGLSEFLFEVNKDEKVVLSHGDLNPANVLFGPEPIVIDWARAFIGPIESDIACTLFLLKIFPIPDDANPTELKNVKENLIECEKEYLKEYNSRYRLNKSETENWIRLVAERTGTAKALMLLNSRIEITWPE